MEERLAEILTNKNFTIIGDSIQLQLYQGLVEFIKPKDGVQYSKNKKFTCFKDLKEKVEPGEIVTAWIDHGHNGYLKFLTAYRIVKSPQSNRLLWATVNDVIDHVKNDDIIMVNVGIHYDNAVLAELAKAIKYLSQRLMKLSMTGATIIYRTTLPQHFMSISGSGWYYESTQKEVKHCVEIKKPDRYPGDAILQYYASKFGFVIFDDFDIFVNRPDLHRDVNDCSHSCFTMETLMPQLALLGQIL